MNFDVVFAYIVSVWGSGREFLFAWLGRNVAFTFFA